MEGLRAAKVRILHCIYAHYFLCIYACVVYFWCEFVYNSDLSSIGCDKVTFMHLTPDPPPLAWHENWRLSSPKNSTLFVISHSSGSIDLQRLCGTEEHQSTCHSHLVYATNLSLRNVRIFSILVK